MIGLSSPSMSPAPREELERLGEEIAGLAVDLHMATYHLLVRLREFDEREGWNAGALAGGFLSCAHWLSWRTGIDLGAAREKVRVARALASLPMLGCAMARCELSYSKARALTRIATPENEAELLELARHATASQVETFVRAWRRADRAAEAEAERRRHESRYLSVHVDEDGSYVVRGRLDPEVGALLERALEQAVALIQGPSDARNGVGNSPAGDVVETGAGFSTAPPVARPVGSWTAGQRRADALGLLVELALGSSRSPLPGSGDAPPSSGNVDVPPSPGRDDGPPSSPSSGLPPSPGSSDVPPSPRSLRRLSRVQFVLHVDADALRSGAATGQSVFSGGVRVSAETSRRLACDASRVIMTHDSGGRVLDVGRSRRTIPVPIRRALEDRDRGCRFPGCTNRLTDAHHVRHWADGGATRLDNLLLLCRRHHRAVHEGGYRVVRSTRGDFAFLDLRGALMPDAPPVPSRMPCASGVLDPARRFESINHYQNAVAGAPSGRLDLAWAMRTMYVPPSATAPGART